MQTTGLLIAALFLPLFPLGMVFNALYQGIRVTWLRSLMLICWPLVGVWLIHESAIDIPSWFMSWALFSAALYGFRAVVVKDIGVWTGFLATSSWALCWIALGIGSPVVEVVLHILAFSLPLVLLNLLSVEVASRYQSVYAGIVNGLARSQPRLSGVLVITMLAVIGSPLFPAFFSMLNSISAAITVVPALAIGLVGVWLLWSWSGVRLLQDILVGDVSQPCHKDISQGAASLYAMFIVILIFNGLYLSGVML